MSNALRLHENSTCDSRASSMTHLRKCVQSMRITTDSVSFMRMPVDVHNNLHIREHFVCTSVFRRLHSVGGPDGPKDDAMKGNVANILCNVNKLRELFTHVYVYKFHKLWNSFASTLH